MFGRPAADLTDASRDPYASARQEMLDVQLRHRGVVMHNVLEAMRQIPRHLFIRHEFTDRAYADEALPSLEGQTISQPFMVAIMTQELNLHAGQRVLEIGTGTGYQTAILAHLVGPTGEVCTIERAPSLADFARHRLAAMDIRNVRFFVGDGSAGWTGEPAPRFDRILVTAGTPAVPPPLLVQLADGGIMVVPVGTADSQTLIRVNRVGNTYPQTRLFACRFVPLVGTHAWNPEDDHPDET